MTRTVRTRKRKAPARNEPWALQDAKARFSAIVRKAKTEGPQWVTLHGREYVVIVAVEEYRRMKGEKTGQALVDLLRESPLRDLDLDRPRLRAPVRRVKL